MKCYIVHRWGGSPDVDWYHWLKDELEESDCHTEILEMPNPDNPKIEEWLKYMDEHVELGEDVILVGHSIGCQAIIRFLEKKKIKIKGCVFVAGWFSLTGLETKEEKEIAKPWLTKKIDLGKVKDLMGKSIAIFSTNDPFVPLDNQKKFRQLGSEIVIEEDKGHYTESDNIKEPEGILDSVMSLLE